MGPGNECAEFGCKPDFGHRGRRVDGEDPHARSHVRDAAAPAGVDSRDRVEPAARTGARTWRNRAPAGGASSALGAQGLALLPLTASGLVVGRTIPKN